MTGTETPLLWQKYFHLIGEKMLGWQRESVYIGLTSTRSHDAACPAGRIQQAKRDRIRLLFSMHHDLYD